MNVQDQQLNTPSAREKAALKGTAGVPSAANPFVTDVDERVQQGYLPVYPRTLVLSQVVPDGWYGTVKGPLTVPDGVALVLEGTAELTIT